MEKATKCAVSCAFALVLAPTLFIRRAASVLQAPPISAMDAGRALCAADARLTLRTLRPEAFMYSPCIGLLAAARGLMLAADQNSGN